MRNNLHTQRHTPCRPRSVRRYWVSSHTGHGVTWTNSGSCSRPEAPGRKTTSGFLWFRWVHCPEYKQRLWFAAHLLESLLLELFMGEFKESSTEVITFEPQDPQDWHLPASVHTGSPKESDPWAEHNNSKYKAGTLGAPFSVGVRVRHRRHSNRKIQRKEINPWNVSTRRSSYLDFLSEGVSWLFQQRIQGIVLRFWGGGGRKGGSQN